MPALVPHEPGFPPGYHPALRAKLQELLNDYVTYCDLKTRHEAALKERKYQKLAERVEANRQRWLAYMVQEVGVEVDGPPSGEKHLRTRLYNAMAGGVVLSKKDPIGSCVLFSGDIEGVRREGENELAHVRLEGCESKMSCFVVVPAGARWVPEARVVVVGRVVDSSGFPTLKADAPEAVVVQPVAGTK